MFKAQGDANLISKTGPCRKGLRTETSIVAETAQCYSTHHMSLLIGYGAHAVCPYLALETCRQWRLSSRPASLLSPAIYRPDEDQICLSVTALQCFPAIEVVES